MMRNTLVGTLFLLFTIGGCSGTQKAGMSSPEKVSTDTQTLLGYQDEIDIGYLKPHLSAFSADSMEGRETGMKGQKKAADYLVTQYKKMGLKPIVEEDSYLQKFKVNATRDDSIVFTITAKDINGTTPADRSVIRENSTANFIPQFSRGDTLDGEIVFVGYGVSNKLDINQLQGQDLQDKWVLAFNNAPQVIDGDTLYKDHQEFYRAWMTGLLQQGVKGVLTIPEITPEEFYTKAEEQNVAFGKPTGMKLAYLDEGQEPQGPSLGINTIAPQTAAELLDLENLAELNNKREDIARNMDKFNAQKTGYELSQISYNTDVKLGSENVMAFLEGGDPELKDEVVVIYSHYDHLGIGKPDSTGDNIYNGADDDGSGVIGTLNIAKSFAEAAEDGVRPRRSILFLNVSGEEKGLLGSRFYSDHPVIPIEKTITNINVDMIGRLDPAHEEKGVEDYSYIIGSKLISSELDSLLHVANERSGKIELSEKYNDLNDPNQFYRRSDHWNFGRLGIPFIFFFTGVHEDYHQPSDEVDKIHFQKMQKIVRTMYATVVMVANADESPKVDNQEFIEITKEG